jgi:hypothetical protein
MSTHTNWLGEFFKHSLLLVGGGCCFIAVLSDAVLLTEKPV